MVGSCCSPDTAGAGGADAGALGTVAGLLASYLIRTNTTSCRLIPVVGALECSFVAVGPLQKQELVFSQSDGTTNGRRGGSFDSATFRRSSDRPVKTRTRRDHLGGQVKTGQLGTGQNRPVAPGRADV